MRCWKVENDMDINELRKEIDAVDRGLVELFARRMEIAAKISDCKREQGLPVLDRAREAEKLDSVAALAGEELGGYARKVFTTLMDVSKDYQKFLAGKSADVPTDEKADAPGPESRNIVLIGMPGCGKSTIGAAAAKIAGRSFYDVDDEICAETGMSIPEIFEKVGERGFRKLETAVLERLGKLSGCVIATGGGCVTVRENAELLRRNGLVVWLERELDALPTDGRPLSQSKPLKDLYEERKEQYEFFADCKVGNNARIITAAEKVAVLAKGSCLRQTTDFSKKEQETDIMLPEKTLQWGKTRSCIRELMEYGSVRKTVVGAENVFDFSLGNPSIPAPDCVNESIAELIKGDSVELHGYTTAAGLMSLRRKIADDLNARFDMDAAAERIYVTCGAAAGLAICMKALLLPGDEVIAPAPFFPEYRVFAESAGGVLVKALPDKELQVDIDSFAACLSEKTRAVIINSPNNPSGAVLSEKCLRAMAGLLREQEKKTGHSIYVISDEPYRELVYDGGAVPEMAELYDDTIICYSYSKSLSVPGERIGYLAVGGRASAAGDVYASMMGAARALGYVNPPSLFQRVIERCMGQTADVSQYKENRDLLCAMLSELGYDFVLPKGAFYLFVRSPEPDAKAFSERAKRFELLLVPSDDFGCGGYVRIAYCVAKETIERSRAAFAALAEEYGLKK